MEVHTQSLDEENRTKKELISAGIIASNSQDGQNYIPSPNTIIYVSSLSKGMNHLHISID